MVAVVDGWEHVRNRVFLQWIRLLPDEHDWRLAHTTAISEINGKNWRISTPRLVLKGKQWQFVIPAEHAFTQKKAVFLLIPSADFKYSLTERPK